MDGKLTIEGLEKRILEIVKQNPNISGPQLFHKLTLLEKTGKRPKDVEEKENKTFYKGHEVHISCECSGPIYRIASITLTKELCALLESHAFKAEGYDLNQKTIYMLEDYVDKLVNQGKLKIKYHTIPLDADHRPGFKYPTYII